MKPDGFFFNFLAVCFILTFSFNITFAQNTATENTFYQQALVNARAVYHQSFCNQSALFNGSEYPEYIFHFESGQPYFYAEESSEGCIVYDGIKYDSILMRYDEIRDLIIINSYTNRIQLWNEKVESFHLFNADFIKLEKDSLSHGLAFNGFYNILYNGKTGLLKKQIRTIIEKITTTEVLRTIDTNDWYYIKKEGKFYPVTSKKNLFKIFEDRKTEVKQFVRSSKLNFRKAPENMLIKTTIYYDSLNK